jgi:hypothetical protein
MLTLLATVLLNSSVLAQSNSEYRFEQMRAADDTRFFGDEITPVNNQTLDCFAVNGYGQWMASSNTGTLANKVPGWFLWGNALQEPSEDRPAGMIAAGPFIGTYPAQPKVTINLHGAVRYIWPSDNRTQFVVQGLNDQRGISSLERQIDIRIPDGFPNTTQSREIVKLPIFTYPNQATAGHNIINNEADFRDVFDVACDQKWIYIVWATDVNTVDPIEVWATAFDINTGAVATGFPLKVSLTKGRRPTVTCDPRANPANPTFDVAYITDITNGNVVWRPYVGNTATSTIVIKAFLDPITGNTLGYLAPKHARILRISYFTPSGGTPNTLMRCLYIITNDNDLIVYKPLQLLPGANMGTYVDGPLTRTYAAPIPPTSPNLGYPVIDKHIVAFANPYDNQTGAYNQFHCMYQLDVSPIQKNPLLIVRGFDNGFAFAGTPDTRLVINRDIPGTTQILDDPSKYVAGVNQMGIHCHWRSGTTHFYSRDNTRAFDEFIDENTLITNACRVKDGTAHGGLTGAQVDAGRIVTLWTDLNNGLDFGDPNKGIYLKDPPSPNRNIQGSLRGSLYFIGNDISFIFGTIGAAVNTYFYTHPNSTFQFFESDLPNMIAGGTNQQFIISSASEWHYYGLKVPVLTNPNGIGETRFEHPCGGGTIRLEAAGVQQAATLHIHGGAQFVTDGVTRFLTNNGKIVCYTEPHLAPILTPGSANPDALGLLRFGGYAQLDNSHTIVLLPQGVKKTFAFVGKLTCNIPLSEQFQFKSDNTLFETLNWGDTPGYGTIEFGDNNAKAVKKCSILQSEFNRVRVHALNTENEFTVSQNDFHKLQDKVVFFERTPNTLGQSYDNIIISHNEFHEVGSGGSPQDHYGIVVKNFNNIGLESNIEVDRNKFEYTDNEPGEMNTAIHLENTTGNVTFNRITDPAFRIGIANVSTEVNLDVPLTHTYFCSNRIDGLVGGSLSIGIGMMTNNYVGYIKSSQILGCEYGYVSGIKDRSKMVFSRIMNCEKEGILTSDATSWVDLSGVHGQTDQGPDIAAFDTISGNGTDYAEPVQIVLTDGSFIDLADNFALFNWQNYAENNIIAAQGSLLLIRGATSNASLNLGNIDRNFWGAANIDPANGGGISPGNWVNGSSDVHCQNISYNCTTTRTQMTAAGSITCSGGYNLIESEQKPMSVSSDADQERCKNLFAKLVTYDNNRLYYMSYDTGQVYINNCAYEWTSYRAFPMVHGSLQFINTDDTSRYRKFREWLISVMFLNTENPMYFCAVMDAIAGTYLFSEGERVPNARLTIYKYMMENNECPGFDWEGRYRDVINARLYYWRQGDTTVPFDSTLHDLDDLGLGFLKNLNTSDPLPAAASYLGAISVIPNPTRGETNLRLTMHRGGYVGYSINDELGRKLMSVAGDYLTEGWHELRVNLSSLPRGVYYLRLTAGYGEIKTVKVIKE